MTQDDPSSRRLGIAVATASAAVTLAIGVTLGTWSGYLGPRREGPAAATAVEAPAAEAGPPAVILVPVKPERAETAPMATDRLEAAFRPPRTRHHDEHEDHEHDD